MSEALTAEEARHRKRQRALEMISVILLSVTAMIAAWSAFQAASWGATMSIKFGQSNTRRVLATRATTVAGQRTQVDIALFSNWLNAFAADDAALADFYRERFRDEFKPAFEAWMATQPATNRDAPKSPFAMPEYQVSQAEEAERLDQEAAALYDEGLAANDQRDGYAMAALLLASVLFLVGIAQRLKWFSLQVALVSVGGVVFLFTLAHLLILDLA